jgi:hypothetical protein
MLYTASSSFYLFNYFLFNDDFYVNVFTWLKLYDFLLTIDILDLFPLNSI